MHSPPHHPAPVVLDTNAVLDWRLFLDPHIGALRHALDEGRLQWLVTAAMLDELTHVLRRPLAPRWHGQRERLLSELESTVIDRVDPPSASTHGLRCTDPDDQKFLDFALQRGVRWLVTRDRALLSLRRRAEPLGLVIVQPRDWHPSLAVPGG